MMASEWSSAGLPLLGLDAGDVGLADITPLGDAVPADLKKHIMATRQAMIDGKFNPYEGPVKNQAGEVVVPAGKVLDDDGLWGMTYFVEGVTGTMPQ